MTGRVMRHRPLPLFVAPSYSYDQREEFVRTGSDKS